MNASEHDPGGQGGVSTFQPDVVLSRSDLAAIKRAIHGKWVIPQHALVSVPSALLKILNDGSDRDKIGAAKVLAEMIKAGAIINPDSGETVPPTNILETTATPVEQRKTELLRRLAACG